MSVDTENKEPVVDPAPGNEVTDTVVHLSDLHFGSGFQPARAADLLEHINEVDPDLVVVSGDLTMRARSEQFQAARDFLLQIKAPLLVIPGNHDVPLYHLPMRALRPFSNYQKYISDLDKGPVRLNHCAFFGLNTVNPWRHQQGKFRLLELLELERYMAEQDDSIWKMAVVHQHFANIPRHERPGKFPGGERILARMSAAGIHGVLHGHVHYHHVASSAEFFPKIQRPVVLVCAGTPTSLRTRGDTPTNNYNVLRFYQDRFEVHQVDWSPETTGFGLSRHVVFDRQFFKADVD